MSLFEELQRLKKNECRNLGKKFEGNTWSQSELEEKLDKMEELVEFLSDELGIEENRVPIVAVRNLENALGSYRKSANIIFIAPGTLEKGGILTARTVAHEVRHAFQADKVRKGQAIESLKDVPHLEMQIKKFIDLGSSNWKEWKENMDNYISQGPGYNKQAIEEDAVYYESAFLKQFFTD